MGTQHDMQHAAQLWSVDALLERLEGDAAWTLAVAQRAFEWDALRVTNLVDSVLRGFPIGSLLVAEHQGPHYRLNDGDRFRDLVSTDEATTQLLDGQQRCRALLATFQGQGLVNPKTGRLQHLWVNISGPNPRFQEFSREYGALCLMRWLDEDLNPNEMTAMQRRAEGMNTRGGEPESAWLPFHTLVKLVRRRARPRTLAKVAQADFDNPEVRTFITQLRQRVDGALGRENIPIHVLSPSHTGSEVADLHQVFVRLNVGGRPLSAADEFFAGAKRYWPAAEEGIRPLLDVLSPLGRRGAITLLARTASRTLDPRPRDPFPLDLEVLARTAVDAHENPLVARMQYLAETTGTDRLATALKWVSDVCFLNLQCGVHGVADAPWMAAVAWALAWARERPLPSISDAVYTQPLLGFVFWSSVLRSQTYGRARFGRVSFQKCWAAGAAGKPIPYGQPTFDRVCFNFDYVQAHLAHSTELNARTSAEDRAQIYKMMRGNRWLFLGPFQRVGVGRGWTLEQHKQPGIEWEHIVPFNKARALFKQSRTYLYEYTDQIGALANFAAIDGRANRVLSDRAIAGKVGWDRSDPSQTYGDFDFLRTRVDLSKTEIELLRTVDEELELGRDKHRAGGAFLRFVEQRSRRIWRRVCGIVGPPPVPTVYEEQVTR